MIWVTRSFKIDGWFDVMDKFEDVFTMLDSPREMMLIAKTDLPNKQLYICLPSEDLIDGFPGFEGVKGSELPENPELIVGHADVFKDRFPFGD